MKKLSMCRICLVENAGLLVVDNKKLHEIYEKLTDIPFVTEDSRPVCTCLDCCNELKQCYQLLNKCLEADERFAQMMLKDYETNPSINQDRNEHYSGFTKIPIEQKIIVEVCPTESIAIKEELPDVCEELDDIVETKEEYQSDEIKAENIDNSCLLDTDIQAQHSESDSEYDVHFKEVKIEVEEEDVSKKIQEAEEMIKIKAENIDNSCLLDTDIEAQHSESDSEYDVHFKEVKIEVEEEDVSKKIQEAEEMIKIKAENIDNSCLLDTDIEAQHSESNSEYDVHFKEVKIEVEEEDVSMKIQEAEEMINIGATVTKNPKQEPSTPEQGNEIRTEHPEKQKTDSKVIRTSQRFMQEPEIQFKEAYKCNQRAKSKIQRTHSQIVEKQFKCDVCRRSFKHKINLINHIRIHTGDKPYKCKICDRNYTRSYVLKKHIQRIHSGVKPYKCDQCELSFNRREELTSHTIVHTGVKPYKCDICERSYTRNDSLKKHSLIHSDEKPFKCVLCQRSFDEKSHLTDHIRVHTREKPFKCHICERSYTRGDSLKKHYLIHTGEKPFKCDLCQRSFSEKSHLKDHIRVHTGEKPYKCDICEKSYGYKKSLTYHIRLHEDKFFE